jgi:hypothetical protein
MTRLDDTQRIFWRLITEREGVAGALVRTDERFGAAERVGVYAGMYFFRLLECLAEDFPAVHAVVGHDDFHGLAADYLAAHPSEHPSVRRLGRRLGDFLTRHPLGEQCFWLADLARFEWSLLEAFDAADAIPIKSGELAAVAPDLWSELRFTLAPSLRVLEAAAAVDEIWKAATEGQAIPSVDRAPTALRVWREGFDVLYRKLESLELEVLRAVARGELFGEICEAAGRIAGDDRVVVEIVKVIRRWLDDGMIIGVRPSHRRPHSDPG